MLFAYFKDRFLPEDQCAVSIHDRSFRFGDGVFDTMLVEYQDYMRSNGVIKPPADYVATRQVLLNNWSVLVRQMAWVLVAAGVLLVALLVGAVYGVRRLLRRKAQP